MKNKSLIILAFVLLTVAGCNKSNKRHGKGKGPKDSLEVYLRYLDSSYVPQKEKIVFGKKAYAALLENGNDSITRESLVKVANSFFAFRDWPDFKKASYSILKSSVKGKDTANIAKSYKYIAEYYKNMQVVDSAFFFYLKSEKIYAKTNDKLNLGKIFLKKGILQFYANDYLGADISTTQAYNLLKNSEDKQTVYQAISMIGIVSNEMKDYSRAIEKHQEALALVRKFHLDDDLNQEATSLNNIGNVYQNQNKNKEAIDNFRMALQSKNILGTTPDLYAILVDNLAYSKFKMKDFNNLPNLFFESLKIRDSLNMPSGIVLSDIHLSEYYAFKNDTVKSQQFANRAIQVARQSRTPSDILASLKQLALVEHKRASIYSKEYIKINDSLQQAERKSQNKLARIQFETDEIILEKDKLAEQNRSLLYFFIGSMFVGLLLFVIRTQRSKNRELLLKQQQQKANEDIYNLMISQQATIEESRTKEKKRIAQELHDGVLGRLFGARLNLDSLNKFTDDESIVNRFNYLAELKNIEQDIREISHDLNREKFVLINNFVAIVHNLLEEQKASFSPDVTATIDEKIKWDSVSNAIKINLYRILQESLQNINKYANAKNIVIELKSEKDSIILKVKDDGAGFDVNGKKKGIGLQNMLSRVNECGGIFDIKSKKEKGTSILIVVPIMNQTILTNDFVH